MPQRWRLRRYEYLRDFVHPSSRVALTMLRFGYWAFGWQEQTTIFGPLFEIGIYHGRSLASRLLSPYGPKSGLSTRYFSIRSARDCENGGGSIADPESIAGSDSSILLESSASADLRRRSAVLFSIDWSHDATTYSGTCGWLRICSRHAASWPWMTS